MPMVMRLRLRFVGAAALIGALLLLFTFSVSFLATALRTRTAIDEKLDSSLRNGFSDRLDFDDLGCMLVLETEGSYVTKRSQQYTLVEQQEIIAEMLSTEDEFFGYDNRIFCQKSITQTNYVLYAVYDATSEVSTLQRLLIIMLIAFSGVFLLLIIISWLLSGSTLKPVVDALNKQKELIANASHELKTPLTIINTQLVLVREEDGLTENAEKWLDGISVQTKRMGTLIREMLELSRLEAGNELKSEEVKISELFESTILSMEAGCFEKKIKLESNIEPDIQVVTDKDKLEKLLTILLDNANKYTPCDGTVKIELYRHKKWVIFQVYNTGAGIPKNKLPKVFERFYKVEESHTGESNSFGLGLSIAKSLADALQAPIRCESEEGKYTVFKVALPIITVAKKEANSL